MPDAADGWGGDESDDDWPEVDASADAGTPDGGGDVDAGWGDDEPPSPVVATRASAPSSTTTRAMPSPIGIAPTSEPRPPSPSPPSPPPPGHAATTFARAESSSLADLFGADDDGDGDGDGIFGGGDDGGRASSSTDAPPAPAPPPAPPPPPPPEDARAVTAARSPFGEMDGDEDDVFMNAIRDAPRQAPDQAPFGTAPPPNPVHVAPAAVEDGVAAGAEAEAAVREPSPAAVDAAAAATASSTTTTTTRHSSGHAQPWSQPQPQYHQPQYHQPQYHQPQYGAHDATVAGTYGQQQQQQQQTSYAGYAQTTEYSGYHRSTGYPPPAASYPTGDYAQEAYAASQRAATTPPLLPTPTLTPLNTAPTTFMVPRVDETVETPRTAAANAAAAAAAARESDAYAPPPPSAFVPPPPPPEAPPSYEAAAPVVGAYGAYAQSQQQPQPTPAYEYAPAAAPVSPAYGEASYAPAPPPSESAYGAGYAAPAPAPQPAAPPPAPPQFMIPSVPAAAAVAGEDPTRANASYAHDQPAATLPPQRREASAEYTSATSTPPSQYSAYGGGASSSSSQQYGYESQRQQPWAPPPPPQSHYAQQYSQQQPSSSPAVVQAAYDDFGMSGGGGAYGDASGAGGGGWASTAPTRLPPRGRARGDDDAPSAAAYASTSHDGGDFSAYNTGGSSHATGDAGTPRSTHGRPPCVGIGFGFGGKLVLSSPGYPGGDVAGGGGAPPGHLRIKRLCDLIRDAEGPAMAAGPGSDPAFPSASRLGPGGAWLDAVTRAPTPGPMTRNASSSALTKFADARAAAATAGEDEDSVHSGGSHASTSTTGGGFVVGGGGGEGDPEGAALLWALLRAMCARRGPLTVPAGSDPTGSDPRGATATAELRALLVGEYHPHGARVGPGVAQPLADAAATSAATAEVERLLLGGERAAALERARAAGLWAHALLLASHMGEPHFAATAAAMARAECVAGSPLHTLELVLAGAPGELVGGDVDGGAATPGAGAGTGDASGSSSSSAAAFAFAGDPNAADALGLLPRWRENLAILAANRARGDEPVIAALGDALWRRRRSPHAAHVAYVLAGCHPGAFHPSSRVCLLGADHRARPRTYVTPAAVQRTELLEHALSSANPQRVLAAFQPYKLAHAATLSELGKAKDALAYVEAVAKACKALDHRQCVECDVHRLAATCGELEHRLRGHLGGKGGVLHAVGKSVFGGFTKILDRGVSAVFGDEGGGGGGGSGGAQYEQYAPHAQQQFHGAYQQNGGGGAHAGGYQAQPQPPQSQPQPQQQSQSQSQREATHSRNPSAHSRNPSTDSVDSSASRSSAAPKMSLWRSVSGVMGAVMPKPKNQAKLGEENTMYYDEKLGRWVEPGKEDDVDSGPPPPPPTSFGGGGAPTPQSAPDASGFVGMPLGTPPGGGGGGGGAPSPNSFSMRAPTSGGVRSRYVDTFSSTSAPVASAPYDAAGLLPPGTMPPGLHPGAAGASKPTISMMVPDASPIAAVPESPRREAAEAGGFDLPDDDAPPARAPNRPTPPSDASLAPEPESGEAPPPPPPSASEADPTEADDGVLATLEVADADAVAADDVGGGGGGATGTDALADRLARVAPFAPGTGTGPGTGPGTGTGSDADADADGSPRAAGPESAGSTSSVPPAAAAAAAVSDYREPEPEPSRRQQGEQRQSGEGYWNARGEWQLGAFPGGFYDESTGAWKSGFYDSEGVFTEGYYDGEGVWKSGQPPTGYWNERGEWTTGAFPGGYTDATRGWLCGYFTEGGEFVEGYYSRDGSWIAGQPEHGGTFGDDGVFVANEGASEGATGGEGEMMDVPL